MDPSRLEIFMALAVGLAFSGAVAEAFAAISHRPASFRLLVGRGAIGLLAAPMLFAAGPFILLRNSLRGRRFERRPVGFVFLGTVFALGWSILSGRALMAIIAFATT